MWSRTLLLATLIARADASIQTPDKKAPSTCGKDQLKRGGSLEGCTSMYVPFSPLSPAELQRLETELRNPSTKVNVLSLRDNKLSEMEAESLIKAATANAALGTFAFRASVAPGAAVVQALVSMLDQHPALIGLDLRGMRLGDEDGVVLAKAIGRNCRLKKLDLSFTHLGPRSAEELAAAVLSAKERCEPEQTPEFEMLSLQHNPFGDEGAEALAGLVSAAPAALKLLILTDAPADKADGFSAEARGKLIAAAKSNPNLDFWTATNQKVRKNWAQLQGGSARETTPKPTAPYSDGVPPGAKEGEAKKGGASPAVQRAYARKAAEAAKEAAAKDEL